MKLLVNDAAFVAEFEPRWHLDLEAETYVAERPFGGRQVFQRKKKEDEVLLWFMIDERAVSVDIIAEL